MKLDPVAAALAGNAPAPAASPKPAPAPTPAPAPVQIDLPAPPSPEELEAAVAQLNRAMRSMHNSLQFEFDKASGRTVVRVIDGETQEVLRQMPSEEMMAIAATLKPVGSLLMDEA